MQQKGFTLAELLVSLTVGALLFAVGIPSLNALVQNSNQIQLANELLSSLHFARDLAITRNVRVTMCSSSDGAGCDAAPWSDGWIVFADPDDDRAVDADETIDRAVSEIDADSVTSGEFGAFLVYRPNGRVMANTIAENTGEITICDQRGADHARVAIIDVSGRPRVGRERMDGSAPVCP